MTVVEAEDFPTQTIAAVDILKGVVEEEVEVDDNHHNSNLRLACRPTRLGLEVMIRTHPVTMHHNHSVNDQVEDAWVCRAGLACDDY